MNSVQWQYNTVQLAATSYVQKVSYIFVQRDHELR